jgi:1-aminocyclopropane-1-carboxylate deaminase/D-cysteine desulfhydrase-like pyridoxal-dependent ACC family enzyme
MLARDLWEALTEVVGVSHTGEFTEHQVKDWLLDIARRTTELLGIDLQISRESLECRLDKVGAGYGIASPESIEAVKLFARTEGIIIDPIYTGKCAAALIEDVRRRRFSRDQTVVFFHTGGVPAIFSHADHWLDA